MYTCIWERKRKRQRKEKIKLGERDGDLGDTQGEKNMIKIYCMKIFQQEKERKEAKITGSNKAKE